MFFFEADNFHLTTRYKPDLKLPPISMTNLKILMKKKIETLKKITFQGFHCTLMSPFSH